MTVQYAPFAAAQGVQDDEKAESIDVCICCYERLTILETLGSLARQRLPDGIAMRVIVADNNALPLSRDAIEQCADRLGLDLRYIHAPKQNISIARNHCLDAASAPWIAFLDDDEVASPDWLARLIVARDGRDVVFGTVKALYPDPQTPRWMVAGDFHSTGMGPSDPPDKGFTGNVLLRRALVADNGLRFDHALGTIGGEDTLFFKTLYRLGARFAHEPRAVLFEEAGPDRATLHWLIRRRFRFGQIHLMLTDSASGDRRNIALGAMAKAVLCLAAAAGLLIRPRTAAACLLRASFHAGVVAMWFGVSPIKGYGGGAGEAAATDRDPNLLN